ncbi:MAG: hypothetical protein KDA96_23010, partial [Planctomycetaceae bacterium]|nr:hypothetical protein [Planctomycetaceae bacterium]
GPACGVSLVGGRWQRLRPGDVSVEVFYGRHFQRIFALQALSAGDGVQAIQRLSAAFHDREV